MTHVCSLPATNCFASERLMTSVPMSSRTLSRRVERVGEGRKEWRNRGKEGRGRDRHVSLANKMI